MMVVRGAEDGASAKRQVGSYFFENSYPTPRRGIHAEEWQKQ